MRFPALAAAMIAMAAAGPMGAKAQAGDLTNEILAFEKVESWTGATPDFEIKHEGAASGAWLDTVANNRIYYRVRPTMDISAYDRVSVWVHSSKANGACIALSLMSPDPAKDQPGSYLQTFVVDWEGWKQLEFPLASFRIIREPLGMDKIERILFASQGYTCGEPKPDTQLRFDDLRFLPKANSGTVEWKPFDGATLGQALANNGSALIYFRSKDIPLSAQFEHSYLLTSQASEALKGRTLYFVETSTMPLVAKQYKVVRVPALALIGPGDKRELLSIQETTDPVEISRFLATGVGGDGAASP